MAETMASLNKGDLEVYSTDETQIGYVNLNGTIKKLYRKTFTGTFPANPTSPVNFPHSISNLDAVLHLEGFSKESLGARRPFNLAYFAEARWDATLQTTDTEIIVEAGAYFLNAVKNSPYFITLEYTKTTD